MLENPSGLSKNGQKLRDIFLYFILTLQICMEKFMIVSDLFWPEK